jgi:hypothetical protein
MDTKDKINERYKQLRQLHMKVDGSGNFFGSKKSNKDFNIDNTELICDSDEEWNLKITKMEKELKRRNCFEYIFYNGNFYYDLDSVINDLEEEQGDAVEDFPDDFTIEIGITEAEPVFKLDSQFIIDHIDEERLDEDGDILNTIRKIIDEHINFDLVNSKIPELHYEQGKMTLTKQDLLDYMNYESPQE